MPVEDGGAVVAGMRLAAHHLDAQPTKASKRLAARLRDAMAILSKERRQNTTRVERLKLELEMVSHEAHRQRAILESQLKASEDERRDFHKMLLEAEARIAVLSEPRHQWEPKDVATKTWG